MAFGAALWGTASQSMDAGNWISKDRTHRVSVGLQQPTLAA